MKGCELVFIQGIRFQAQIESPYLFEVDEHGDEIEKIRESIRECFQRIWNTQEHLEVIFDFEDIEKIDGNIV